MDFTHEPLSDQVEYAYKHSISEAPTEYLSSSHNYAYINDTNASSYASAPITFSNQQLAAAGQGFFDAPRGYVEIPITVTLTVGGNAKFANADAINDDICAAVAPLPYFHLLHSVQLTLNSHTVSNNSPYQNIFTSLVKCPQMNKEQVDKIGDLINYEYPIDEVNGREYDLSTYGEMATGLLNNAPTGGVKKRVSSGFLKRAARCNTDYKSSTTVESVLFGKDAAEISRRSGLIDRTDGVITLIYCYHIPLPMVSEIFGQIGYCRTFPGWDMRLFHNAESVWRLTFKPFASATGTGKAYPSAVTLVTGSAQTCPVQLACTYHFASSTPNASVGLGLPIKQTNAPVDVNNPTDAEKYTIDISVNIGWGTGNKLCRIYLPQVDLSPTLVQDLAEESNARKSVRYLEYLLDQNVAPSEGIKAGVQVTHRFNTQVRHARYLYLFVWPKMPTGYGNYMLSPITSKYPAPVSLKELNILVGGTRIFKQSMSHDMHLFDKFLSAQGAGNGNYIMSQIMSGTYNRKAWEQAPVFAIDLMSSSGVLSNEEDSLSRDILIEFTINGIADDAKKFNVWAMVSLLKMIDVNHITGEVKP